MCRFLDLGSLGRLACTSRRLQRTAERLLSAAWQPLAERRWRTPNRHLIPGQPQTGASQPAPVSQGWKRRMSGNAWHGGPSGYDPPAVVCGINRADDWFSPATNLPLGYSSDTAAQSMLVAEDSHLLHLTLPSGWNGFQMRCLNLESNSPALASVADDSVALGNGSSLELYQLKSADRPGKKNKWRVSLLEGYGSHYAKSAARLLCLPLDTEL